MKCPCRCGRARSGPYTRTQCRVCWLALNDRRAQIAWGLVPPPPPCPFRGEIVRVECPRGNKELDVVDCGHPEADWDFCMTGRSDNPQVQSCSSCRIRPTV